MLWLHRTIIQSVNIYLSLVLIKVPGRFSGFLAVDAVGAARNANVCLVPEFKIDLYGEKGLLNYIANRV
jgi:6-phosphofructokinase 1